MPINPIARYMILCDDWMPDPANIARVQIIGLISNIRPLDDPHYPMLVPELGVFLAPTDGRGSGIGQDRLRPRGDRRQDLRDATTSDRRFGPDPIEILGVPFRIRDCVFPHAGLYTVQFGTRTG